MRTYESKWQQESVFTAEQLRNGWTLIRRVQGRGNRVTLTFRCG